MKIAFLLPSLEKKGPIIFTKNLISGLSANSYFEMKVFYFKEKKNEIFIENATKIKFFQKINFEEFDILITTMLMPDLYGLFYSNKVKYHLIGIHNFIKEDLRFLYPFPISIILNYFWNKCLVNADLLVCSSNAQATYYNKITKTEKTEIITYGLPKRENEVVKSFFYEIPKSFTDNSVIIGSCGNLIKRKGYQDIINSLNLLPEKFKVILIGNGSYKNQLQNMVRKNSLENRVIFIDETDEYWKYYELFDIYCHSSYSEGFGLALIEAFQKEIPVALSNLEIYSEIIPDNLVGKFKAGSCSEISKSLLKLSLDINLYKSYSKQIYNNSFSIEKMIIEYKKLFKTIY